MSYGKPAPTKALERTKPTMRRYVIAFNGPPRSGKDTATRAVCTVIRERANWMQVEHMDMAEPLKRGAHAMFAAFHGHDFYDLPANLAQKDLPCGDFLGLTPREIYIALSEEFLKPKFGNEVLGYIARKKMVRMNSTRIFVFSNGGFVDEWKPIIGLVGEENFLFVEVHAAGKDFVNDSRGYIGEELKQLYPKMKLVRLVNTFGDQEDRELFRILAQGAAVNFLRHEFKDEE